MDGQREMLCIICCKPTEVVNGIVAEGRGNYPH